MQSSDFISDIALDRRRRNAQALALALTVLGGAGVVACQLAHAPQSALLATAGQGLLCLIAYLLLRRGRHVSGVVLMMLGPLVQHVTIVATMRALTVLPFISTLAVLLAAATLPLKRLYLGVILAAFAILIEASLVDLSAHESMGASGLLAGSVLYLGVVVVISVLHVRGTERATALAREREQARERAAAAARASEERYRLIAENTTDLIALLDCAGVISYASPSHERVIGRTADELVGSRMADFVASAHHAHFERCLIESTETGGSRTELLFATRSGCELLFDTTFNRVHTEGGVLVTIMSRNITEKRVLEESLQKSRRMEALGRMARGVAHDFNNLLTAMLGNLELADAELPPDHPVHADLLEVREAAQSASRFTQQLLAFSRSQTGNRTVIHPATELAKLSMLLTAVVGKSVQIEIDSDEDCPPVRLHGGHFEQILLNLGTNAAHASSGRGKVRIRLVARTVGVGEIAQLKAGRYVELSVADEGAGIAPETIPHLFEPFFTTRGQSGGTGLGLATCYGIATQHGGQIVVESELGKGSTFRVLLPVASDYESTPAAPTSQGPNCLLSGVVPARPRVLLVDDEASVREVARRMLEADGFEVYPVGTLAAAMAALKDSTLHFDVLLTDVVLSPGLGTDLLGVARQVRPSLRLCVMSGLVPNPEIESTVRVMGATFLSKPFDRAALLSKVRAERRGEATHDERMGSRSRG